MEIYVATDLWGRKDNVRILLPPRLFVESELAFRELIRTIEDTYDQESRRLCPSHINPSDVPRFRVAHAQILVDESKSAFVDVVSDKQLYNRCQLFVFQPPNHFHSDSRDFIPLPRDVQLIVTPSSPSRLRMAPSTAVADYSAASAGQYDNDFRPRSPTSLSRHASGASLTSSSAAGGATSSYGTSSPLRRRSSPVRDSTVGPSSPPRRSPFRHVSRSPAPPTLGKSQAERIIERPGAIIASGASPVPTPDPYLLTRPTGALPLEAAQAVFQALDRKGQQVVPAAEVKARLVTLGVDASDPVLFPAGFTMFGWSDWLQFCDAHPDLLAFLADRLLGIAVLPVASAHVATVASAPRQPSGERWRSPPRHEAEAGPVNRDMSPRRTNVGAGDRQQKIAERLHSGLASIVTCKDRQKGDYSHAVKLLGTVSATQRRQSPRTPRGTTSPRR